MPSYEDNMRSNKEGIPHRKTIRKISRWWWMEALEWLLHSKPTKQLFQKYDRTVRKGSRRNVPLRKKKSKLPDRLAYLERSFLSMARKGWITDRMDCITCGLEAFNSKSSSSQFLEIRWSKWKETDFPCLSFSWKTK